MKRLKIGLLARIIIAITLGIGFGNVLPGELVRVFVTFNGIFSDFGFHHSTDYSRAGHSCHCRYR